MSTWRDIWRYGVIANRIMATNRNDGEKAFSKLFQTYGDDGMIHYIKAESYEHINESTLALKEYKKARKQFPVKHWKQLANDSYNRVKEQQSVDYFYNVLEVPKKSDSDDIKEQYFKSLLWSAFQKVYGYTYLNDFARYVCLSALARGSSEWPLSLVDFRTVLELEIKQCFPEKIIKEKLETETRYYSLYETINKLKNDNIIDEDTYKAFNSIRIAGNIAAHNLYTNEDFKISNVNSFIKLLEYFNNFIMNNTLEPLDKNEYPLCQLNIEEFCDRLNKKI